MYTAEQVQQIIDASRRSRERIEQQEDDFLRKAGWNYTCQVPGNLWLWEKSLPDGRTVLVEKAAAFAIEEALSPCDEPCDDDWDDDCESDK